MPSPTHSAPPLPIGYIEVQRSWVGELTPDEIRGIIAEAREAALRDYPGYRTHSSRIEVVTDGAGVPHSTLYLGFAPGHVAAEPLNPRNLNNAPLSQPGQMQDDHSLPLGYREGQFGRGSD